MQAKQWCLTRPKVWSVCFLQFAYGSASTCVAGMQKNSTYLEDSYAAACISEITMESTVFLLLI